MLSKIGVDFHADSAYNEDTIKEIIVLRGFVLIFFRTSN